MRQIINNYGRPGKLILNAGKIVDKLKQLFVFNMVLSRIGLHTGRKDLSRPIPVFHLFRSEEEKVCQCGASLSRIGQDTCEKLDYIPAKVRGCSATSAINMPAKPVKALKMTVPR